MTLTMRAPANDVAPAATAEPAAAAMAHLVQVVQDLSTSRTLERVQEIVRRAARALTGADGATFVLRDGDQCYYADEDAIAPLWKGKRFPMTACISGWSMLHDVPVVIPDIYADERVPVDAYRPTFVQSLAMVPIRARQPVGAIGTYWATHHAAGAGELRVLQALADSTSIALENVGLLRELRAAKDAAEVAYRLRDEFLAMLSHELRTPLNPILAWSELLLSGPASAAEVAEAAGAIHAAALAELRHVEALLDVSQMLAGTFRLRRARTALGPVVDSAVAAIAPVAGAKGVVLQRVHGAEAATVLADAPRLRQAVGNLLDNAVKFTPAGGSVQVAIEGTGAGARIVVTDTGEGIAPEFMPRLFEHFRQQDGSATRTVGGMGLGLALVRHLVELHGGRVEAASAGKGQGATFTVTLPVAAPAAGGDA